MSISSFTNVAQQPGINLDAVVGRSDGGALELRTALNPPGRWTQFKAALSQLPLFGQIGTLRQARAECESYPLRLQQYQASNRQVLAGFVRELRAEFGDHIGAMTERGLGLQDGAPLRARDVSAALEGVGRAQQHCRSQNNRTLTRLLESPLQAGQRLRGEQDMTGVFLERNLPLRGASSWQEAVGPAAAKFITQQVMGRCAQLPEHSRDQLSNAQIVAAMNDALALYQEISGAPGMTPQKLDEIMGDAGKQTSPQSAARMARELAVMSNVESMLGRRDPESMLCREAADIVRGHGLAPPTDGLLKSISNGMAEKISMNFSALSATLGCAPDTASTIRAVQPVLTAHVRRAVDEHCQALKLIEASPTLKPAQKDLLREIASQRRIDPAQLAAFEKLSATMARAMEASARCAGDPARAVSQLLGAIREFQISYEAMQVHADAFWEAGSLGGVDTIRDAILQFSRMAAAGLDDPGPLLRGLSSDAVKEFVQGIATSPSSKMTMQLPMVLGPMVQALGMRSGMSSGDARQLGKDVVGAPAVERGVMKPALVLAALTEDPEMLDERGVVDSAPSGGLVAGDFSQQDVLAATRRELIDYIHSDGVDEERGIAKTTVKDLHRATFNIGGEELPRDGEQVQRHMDGAFPDTEPGRRMKLAVSRCMNQLGINAFVGHCDNAAFGAGSLVAAQKGRTQYEAWPQEDGSWLVRNTHAREPQMIARTDGTTTELPAGGTAVYSLTFRVGPGVGADGNPTIDIASSNVAFEF